MWSAPGWLEGFARRALTPAHGKATLPSLDTPADVERREIKGAMVRVDRLSPDEGPRLREIRLRALDDSPDAFGETFEAARARTPEDWTKQAIDLPTFVAVVDDEDAGMVRCCQDRSDPSTAWLLSMWVAPTCRGRGIGAGLVREVVAWARAHGCRRILLEVADENRPAIALYASQGFAPNGGAGSLPAPRDHILEHQRELGLEEPRP